jgi:hypothetical protein
MAIDFKKLLSADRISRIEAAEATMARLHSLPDRFLAREILRLARDARRQISEFDNWIHDPFYGTYNVLLLWHVLPELAARLGETSFQPNERRDADLATRTGADFRDWVSSCIAHNDVGHRYGYKDKGSVPTPCYLLGQDVCNGNPIAIALDRLCPPGIDSTDSTAKLIREVGRYRFGDNASINTWSPAFQNYKQNRT